MDENQGGRLVIETEVAEGRTRYSWRIVGGGVPSISAKPEMNYATRREARAVGELALARLTGARNGSHGR